MKGIIMNDGLAILHLTLGMLALLAVSTTPVLGFVPILHTRAWKTNKAPFSILRNANDIREAEIAVMEELSRMGAGKIAAMDIAERTKRAMLAEAVEDRIFNLQEEIESLVIDGTIAEEDRERAVQLAQQTKVLQGQYQELVSGEPSALLGLVEAATGKSSADDEDDGSEEK